PEGQEFRNIGCYLEVVENERLVWTAALLPGYRPIQKAENGAGLLFTAIILMESHGKGTKYTAIAVHGDESSKKAHDEMSFRDGWGKALDQMVDMIREAHSAR